MFTRLNMFQENELYVNKLINQYLLVSHKHFIFNIQLIQLYLVKLQTLFDRIKLVADPNASL